MKNIAFIIMLFVATGLFAQKITVQETNGKFLKENHNALLTTVYYSTAEDVEKELKSLFKSYKGKVKTKKGVILGDDLVISSVSENTIDVFATVKQLKDGEVEVLVAFYIGGADLSSSAHPDQYPRAQEIIKNFALNLTEQSFAEIVKEEEKELEKFTKDYEKVVENKEGLEKDNEDYKKQIEQNEKEIEKLTKEIETLSGELKEKQDAFEKLKKEGTKIK
ncbi:MAG: hypothetical protein C0596_03375 [Marinilabiliales bacterium]|nr:MAG: hypothetical protein C0596_03375 [Marinilabiliales bacterium]